LHQFDVMAESFGNTFTAKGVKNVGYFTKVDTHTILHMFNLYRWL
jgi:hypothetical protein